MEFWALFAITPAEALAVVLSAVAIYAVFLALVRVLGARVLGARVLAQLSTFDVLIVIMLGAVAGRIILMDVPVLPAGLLGLTTLLVLQAIVGEVRRRRRGHRLVNRRAVVLVAHGVCLERNLRRAHVTLDELAAALRRAGCWTLDDVACAVFEANGHISVARRGAPLDPRLLEGAVGAELLAGDDRRSSD